MSTKRQEAARDSAYRALARRSPWMCSGLRWLACRLVRSHFRAVRVSLDPDFALPPEGPVLAVSNHAGGWDGLIYLVLTGLFPDWEHFGVTAHGPLNRGRLSDRFGFVTIRRGTLRGAEQFLFQAGAVLERPRAMLWIAAQGHVTDPRRRPPGLEAGVGHLSKRMEAMGRGVIVPMALEYSYWYGRRPEVLVRFGAPLSVAGMEARSPREWTAWVEDKMTAIQDDLAWSIIHRKQRLFETLLPRGPGWIQKLWARASGWRRRSS